MTAVSHDHLQIAEILLKNGADMNYMNKVSIDPCMHARNTSMHNVANVEHIPCTHIAKLISIDLFCVKFTIHIEIFAGRKFRHLLLMLKI